MARTTVMFTHFYFIFLLQVASQPDLLFAHPVHLSGSACRSHCWISSASGTNLFRTCEVTPQQANLLSTIAEMSLAR
jgi:hypothetical protein